MNTDSVHGCEKARCGKREGKWGPLMVGGRRQGSPTRRGIAGRRPRRGSLTKVDRRTGTSLLCAAHADMF